MTQEDASIQEGKQISRVWRKGLNMLCLAAPAMLEISYVLVGGVPVVRCALHLLFRLIFLRYGCYTWWGAHGFVQLCSTRRENRKSENTRDQR